jgi:ankyrin repeat protein
MMVSKKSVWENIVYNDYMYNEDEALVAAVHNNKSEKKIDRLLEIGADPFEVKQVGYNQSSAFCSASKKGDLLLMDKFLQADCVKKQEEIIKARRVAVKSHKIDSISHLFGKGYVDGLDEDRLIAAREAHDPSLMKALFENDDLTPPSQEELDVCFVAAASAGRLDNLKYLRSQGASLDASDGRNNALTAVASVAQVQHAHVAIIRYLKEEGFSFEKADSEGKLAAETAAKSGHRDLTLLIDPKFPEEKIAQKSAPDGPFFAGM